MDDSGAMSRAGWLDGVDIANVVGPRPSWAGWEPDAIVPITLIGVGRVNDGRACHRAVLQPGRGFTNIANLSPFTSPPHPLADEEEGPYTPDDGSDDNWERYGK